MAVFKRSYRLQIQIGDVQKTYTEIEAEKYALQIEFNVYATTNATIPEAEITIFGLSLEDMQLLYSTNLQGNKLRDNAISLEAGYGGDLALLIKGSFYDVQPDFNTKGNKIILKVKSGVANNLKNNNVVTSLAGEIDFKEICNEVAKNNSLTLNYQVQEKKSLMDYSFIGTPFQQILNLRTYFKDVDINIDATKEMLNVLKKNESDKNEPYELSNQTGLIGIPEYTTTGIMVTSFLNTNLMPNKKIKLKNAKVTTMDGTYKIVDSRHQGGNRSLDWITRCTMIKV